MTLDCVKNVSSLRERNSSQGSFLFVCKPPKQGASRVFLLFRALWQKPGLVQLVQIQVFTGITNPILRRADAPNVYSAKSGIHGLVVAIAGLSELLGDFLKESVLHNWINLLSSHLADAALCLGVLGMRTLLTGAGRNGKRKQHRPQPGSS